MDASTLGDYLRARRELVQPVDVGIRVAGVRRVPGLRREEVAMLAGISADYYLRLEQGRDRSPSLQVVEALARVLQLDTAATSYLAGLAQPGPRRAMRPRREVVPAGILRLLEVIELPAFVEGRTFDVLASNPLARALSPNLVPGHNRLRDFLLDADEQALYVDWERSVHTMVAGFRASVGASTDDPQAVQLVGELSLASDRFRRLWARHDVSVPGGGDAQLRHPIYGDLEFSREKLNIPGAGGMLLAVYHAERGSVTAGMLRLMGSVEAMDAPLAAPDTVDRPARD